MKFVNAIKNLLASLYKSLKRFPISIGLCIATTLVLIFLTHNQQIISSETRDTLGRIGMTLALGVPISLCIKFLSERRENTSIIVKAAAYAVEAIFLVLYYFFLLKDFKMVPVTRYIGISLAFYLPCLFIPYFFRRKGLELYVIKVFTRFMIAILYSVVLFLGLAAILFTIDKLLGIVIQGRVYFDIWLAVAGIFAPSFFLAGIPAYSDQFEISDYPWLLRVLLLYIVMPLISAYTAILYIYFAKIIITLQWPVGLVAHLVLWYSAICAVVMFLISPLEDMNKWAKAFIFWLSKIIIPLILMMFVSIGIRIKAYGITENRYFVAVLGLWALGVMTYISLSKSRKNIIMLISLSLIAVLSVVGPWSSYSVSKLSQVKRFESILSRNAMIKDGKVAKPGSQVPEEDKREISAILYYFSNSHKLSDIKYLPEGFKMEDMQNVFGFPPSEERYNYVNQGFFTYSSEMPDRPIDIKGYDYLIPIRGYLPPSFRLNAETEIRYDNESFEIKVYSAGKEVYRKSMQEIGKQLYGKYGAPEKSAISPEEMTFTDENEKLKIRFIIQNISGQKDSASGNIRISSIDFYMLMSKK